jgi:branched-chain amino acid transport system permease protein
MRLPSFSSSRDRRGSSPVAKRDVGSDAAPGRVRAHRFFATRSRARWEEIAFWVLALASGLAFQDQLMLIAQILIAGLFALSLDLLLGYTGVASLGHAAFFGLGAYAAALLAHAGWGEPISGLLLAALVAGAAGFLCSLFLARVSGLALLMTTLAVGLLLFEISLRARAITGGEDGIQGITIQPVLGLFSFDLYGRTAFGYVFVVVLLLYLAARRLVYSPFGLSLEAIRENVRRVPAIGIPVRRRFIATFTIATALAGIAGALLTQTTQTVAISVFAFDRSVAALIMVVLGGAGSLVGGLVGAAAYMVAQNWLAQRNPVYWNFWVGLMLVLIVLFARGGIIGGLRRIGGAIRQGRR